MDIIITIPKKTSWEDYQKELDAVADGSQQLNYKARSFPRFTKVGDRCYVVHKGKLKGYMIISGFSTKKFTCTTTGKKFEGKFIQRTGKFFEVEPVDYKSFRSFKYFGVSQ